MSEPGECRTVSAALLMHNTVSAMPSPYHDHLRRSLKYVEEHLLGDLSLEDCAKAAGYSAYHFHRVFRMVLGVTPGVYIRRRRLSIAADLMARSGMNLDSIAEAAGFSCKEVLIRAFQREHGISPSSYREAHNCLRLQPDVSQWFEGEAGESDLPLVPRIASMPAMTIVGYAVTVTREEARAAIPRLWNRYNALGLRNTILSPLPSMQEYDIGVSTNRNRCGHTYIAGRPVQRVQDDLRGLVVYSIPARRYVVFATPPATHSTFVATVHRTWNRIVNEWIPSSPWPLDPTFDFEMYCEAGRTYSEEIWIPIMPDKEEG